jgi:hypothetical protein
LWSFFLHTQYCGVSRFQLSTLEKWFSLKFKLQITSIYSSLSPRGMIFFWYCIMHLFSKMLNSNSFQFGFLIYNQVRLVFEGYGTVVEVVLLRDKKTGARQGIYIELSSVISLVYITICYCNLVCQGLQGVTSFIWWLMLTLTYVVYNLCKY